MLLRTVIAWVALSLVSAAQAAEPQWLKDARAREARTGAARVLKSKDDWMSARVPAKVVGDIVLEQKSYSITFDVGGDAPIFCEVVPQGFDMADMLHRTFDLTMKQIEEMQGKVEAKDLEYTDAGAIGGVPYLQTRWLYRVNDGKETRVGGLKQITMEKHGHGLYCAHVDLGYVKTFDAVTHALAESFEAPPVATAPYYSEIHTTSVAGKDIGVTIFRLERDTDGDTKATEMSAMLLWAADQLRSQDALHIEWVRPDGSFINASHFLSKDGELVTNVELKRAEDGWVVQGESQGKNSRRNWPTMHGLAPGSNRRLRFANYWRAKTRSARNTASRCG